MPTSAQHLRHLEDVAHELDLVLFALEQRRTTSDQPPLDVNKLHQDLASLRQRLVVITHAIEHD